MQKGERGREFLGKKIERYHAGGENFVKGARSDMITRVRTKTNGGGRG